MQSKLRTIFILGVAFVSLSCAYHGMNFETGKPINEKDVSKIVVGETTGSQVLSWFGAPTKITRLGDEEVFVYRYCKTEGSSTFIVFAGQTGTKEKCNELSVTLNKTTGKVSNFGYIKNKE
jgi:hypothetical protein